jgi:hypothetical protein
MAGSLDVTKARVIGRKVADSSEGRGPGDRSSGDWAEAQVSRLPQMGVASALEPETSKLERDKGRGSLVRVPYRHVVHESNQYAPRPLTGRRSPLTTTRTCSEVNNKVCTETQGSRWLCSQSCLRHSFRSRNSTS